MLDTVGPDEDQNGRLPVQLAAAIQPKRAMGNYGSHGFSCKPLKKQMQHEGGGNMGLCVRGAKSDTLAMVG